MKHIKLKQVSEHPHSGLKRLHVKADGAAVILEWLNHDTSRIRGYRAHKGGGFGFSAGGGINVVDADLLGGTGNGKAERQFQDDTGHIVSY